MSKINFNDIDIESRRTAVTVHNETAPFFVDQYSQTYVKPYTSFLYGRRQIDYRFEQLLSLLPKDSNIIDIGCGTGEKMKLLSLRGFKVTGIEPSEKMRTIALANNSGLSVLNGSVLSAPFSTGVFDMALSIEVFRYLSLRDNLKGFAEINRILKPNGYFFGTFVNLFALDLFAIHVGFNILQKTVLKRSLRCHTEFETPWGLSKKLRECGFRRIWTYGGMFAPLRLIFKIHQGLGNVAGRCIEPFDKNLCNGFLRKAFSGHLIVIAQK